MLSCSRNHKRTRCSPRIIGPSASCHPYNQKSGRINLRSLKEQEENLHFIPDEQFGFRRTLSTGLQILRMTEYITEGFNRKEETGAVLLDVSKAFDTVLA